jgi:hypothetical protein
LFHDAAPPSAVLAPVSAVIAQHRSAYAVQILVYLLITGGLFACYGAVLWMAKRGDLAAGPARSWALGLPCLFYCMLALAPPSLSQDLYSYMAHGFLGGVPGGNPLLRPAYEVVYTPFGSALAAHGWHGRVPVTPYGILWTRLEMAIVSLSRNDVSTALILFKLTAISAAMASAWLIWTVLGRLSPSLQLFGTLLYSWNPLVIVETAGEGHNDVLMVFFALLALAACIWRSPVGSVVATALSVITKYVSVLFLPAQLVYLWRTRQSAMHLALQMVLALVIVASVAAALYGPLWAGLHTFDGLIQRGAPLSSASPLGAINWFLRRSALSAYAAQLTIAFVGLPTLAFVAWASSRVRDAASLAKSFAWISMACILFAAPDYWPWYSCLPIALIAASNPRRLCWLVVLMSVAGRCCAPLNLLYDQGFLSFIAAKALTTGLCTTVPLMLVLAWIYRHRTRSDPLFA